MNKLQHREQTLTKQLQQRDTDRQTLELRIVQLQSLAASLNVRLDTDRQVYQQLEQQLATLTHYCQEQQSFATKLDRQIQEKQALNLEIQTNSNRIKSELSQFQSAKIQAIDEIHQAQASLTNIQIEADRYLKKKQELSLDIQQLQARQIVDNSSFDLSLDRQHQLIHELDSAITTRRLDCQNLTAEIDRLAQLAATRSTELESAQQQLSETESTIQSKQVQLAELAAAILARNNEIESSPDYLAEKMQQRELKIAQLELNSKQAELDNLELKLQARLQEIDTKYLDENLQEIEPKPPKISRNIEAIDLAESWHDRFIDNPHLTVLQHIEKHGTITEAEASKKLGNARSVRQFANKLEEYAQDLPFSIRVESSPKGNRYLKETQN